MDWFLCDRVDMTSVMKELKIAKSKKHSCRCPLFNNGGLKFYLFFSEQMLLDMITLQLKQGRRAVERKVSKIFHFCDIRDQISLFNVK